MRIALGVGLALGLASLGSVAFAQGADPGRQSFEIRCARCHGGDGRGGEMGPSIVDRLPAETDASLATLIRDGRIVRGMAANPMGDPEMATLVRFLRSIQLTPEQAAHAHPSLTVTTADGQTITGEVLGEGLRDLQLRAADDRIHLLRRDGSHVREVTSEQDWPTYNGDPRGNRFTTLTQINAATVGHLAPAWTFTVPGAGTLQGTPLVVDGVMYVTAPNECWALDAGSGRPIWHFKRPRTTGAVGGGANRGAAVAGDRLFMATDAAHLLALDRLTGRLLWEAPMGDWRENYFASSAPLPTGDLVVSGVSGGEHGANGFVVAFDQATGKEVWRFWTVPKRGTPLAETWRGKDIDHGGAPTWFTGSYDPTLDLVYWPVGNPSKEYNGADRLGDNLYSDCLLALDRKTGALRWYYQFTPHDSWDWDSTETSVLVDRVWNGQPRKLLLHADRNGFFYVFDRATGKLLLAKPFVRNLTWATRIGDDGRPVELPDQIPTPEGTKVCPSQDGATNWFSPSFNPATGLFYLQTFEKCSIYTRSDQGDWQAGKPYLGGSQRVASDPVPQRVLKAIDVGTGRVTWELPQPGPAVSWGGTLATASGLVFFGDEGGSFAAADAKTGALLWSFPANAAWRASPMTYEFDHRQFIAVAAGDTILAFAE